MRELLGKVGGCSSELEAGLGSKPRGSVRRVPDRLSPSLRHALERLNDDRTFYVALEGSAPQPRSSALSLRENIIRR